MMRKVRKAFPALVLVLAFAALIYLLFAASDHVATRMRQNMSSAVLVMTEDSWGNGVVVESAGYVITVSHIIPKSWPETPSFPVIVSGLGFSKAVIVDVDAKFDLALLKMEKNQSQKQLPAVVLGKEESLKKLAPVYLIHHLIDYSLTDENFSILDGIVIPGFFQNKFKESSDKTGLRRTFFYLNVIPGASGAGIYDQYGHLVSLAYGFRPPHTFLSFGISASTIKVFLGKNRIPYHTPSFSHIFFHGSP